MEMSGYNSFYGGRRGASFVIVKKFASISDMVAAFSQGGSYKTVNYDEYVLIDTVSKNDTDNGKIFRRGYEYNNEMGGAIYMGQIVGPAGYSPHVELKTIAEVEAVQERDNFTYRRGTGSYAPNENLVPGKYIDNTLVKYNDKITWAYCSVRDENEADTTVHVGFKFPYTVIEYEANSVNPYYHRSNNTSDFINENLVERIDDETHPFYEKWHINVPKGIKGDALKNLRVQVATTAIEEYDGQQDDISNGREVLVYNYYDYSASENPTPKQIYLGDYNMISSINLADDGTLTIDYTHDDTITYTKKIKWINTITLDTSNGRYKIQYNDGTEYNTQLVYPISVELDPATGEFTMTYTDESEYNTQLVYPVSTAVNGATGVFTMTFSDTSTYTTTLVYPSDLSVNTGATEGAGNQKIHVTYTDGTSKDIGNPINYIMRTACNINTAWHLYILYADPAKRGSVTYDGRNDWTDLGYIGNGEVGCVAAKESDQTAQTLLNELPPYSTWLIIEEDEPSSI